MNKPLATNELLNKFPWLKVSASTEGEKLHFERAADNIIFNELKDRNKEPPYDPLLIETLLTGVGPLLDRCAAYRREIYDLQARALKQALDYDLFDEQSNDLERIELAAFTERIAASDRDNHTAAEEAFRKDETAPLAKGLRETARAVRSAAEILVKAEIERKQAVTRKWTSLREYQTNLQMRHTLPGHALNFVEQFERVVRFLKQDIVIAFDKLRAIDAGLRHVFKKTPFFVQTPFPPLPAPATSSDPNREFDHLGELIMWTRTVIDLLERGLVDEFEFDHVVSLRQPRGLPGKQLSQLISNPEWTTSMNGNGFIEFSLSEEFPEAIQNLRVRGIGLCLAHASPEKPVNRLIRMAAVVFPPRVKNLFSDRSERVRAPVILENIAIHEPGLAFPIAQYDSIVNIDPREGKWGVKLSSNLNFPDVTVRRRNATKIQDIKLVLRLRASAEMASDKWAPPLSW